jgi:hypothetical protein
MQNILISKINPFFHLSQDSDALEQKQKQHKLGPNFIIQDFDYVLSMFN